MEDKDRQSLINYRIQQAKETIELAEFLKNSGKLAVAVNRIYYGLYYSLTALALKNKFETSKHLQLIGWFNSEFITTNKINKRSGKTLRNAYQNRRKGDYDAFVDFTLDEVETMLQDMKDFVNEIENYIKE
ncbi:MAG: HEPN domain-containing protein [Alphaproteobacteria bacterium]|nr:MAG: HEPN domain-containing protein [Alphaproteobacteria bacterium]